MAEPDGVSYRQWRCFFSLIAFAVTHMILSNTVCIKYARMVLMLQYSVRNEGDSRSMDKLSGGHIIVCGRKVPLTSSIETKPSDNSRIKRLDRRQRQKSHELSVKKNIVIIGHDKMNHVQTNNHINAILHAMDYAADIGAELVLMRSGWATESLKMLFAYQDGDEAKWKSEVARSLNLFIAEDDNEIQHIFPSLYYQLFFNSSDDMYYYHTAASIEVMKQRRIPVLQYLWSHPSHGQYKSQVYKDMCSSVTTLLRPDEQYVVVHSRWMTNNGCLGRMGSMAARLRYNTIAKETYDLERKAPCMLPPSYIKNIIRISGFEGKRIFMISDGKNPSVFNTLKSDPEIGSYVHTVPNDTSWVGGDMMLAVLADVFIGAPISTLAGNVARARVALGYNSSTNYLFPKKLNSMSDNWEFFCDDSCLYDVNILNNYVG